MAARVPIAVASPVRIVGGFTCLIAALAASTAACTADPGRPPLARIQLAPGAIPEHDDFQSTVTLDGSSSADPVDDPEGTTRLSYQWEIVGDEHRFDSGDATDAAPVVRFRGERPATIVLTVIDVDGLEAIATEHLQLTVR
ncbi:MAG: hypothetical protein H6709_15530 [Kofleriaceae bacterium]|nr:hypothetical protein [Myxococcales bacterium]MCB9561436.1 hypothetical protein [Kofleriaceae bacterium]MCB9573490.1 hypothetical protein [Kofleriaceae bacterium]